MIWRRGLEQWGGPRLLHSTIWAFSVSVDLCAVMRSVSAFSGSACFARGIGFGRFGKGRVEPKLGVPGGHRE